MARNSEEALAPPKLLFHGDMVLTILLCLALVVVVRLGQLLQSNNDKEREKEQPRSRTEMGEQWSARIRLAVSCAHVQACLSKCVSVCVCVCVCARLILAKRGSAAGRVFRSFLLPHCFITLSKDKIRHGMFSFRIFCVWNFCRTS